MFTLTIVIGLSALVAVALVLGQLRRWMLEGEELREELRRPGHQTLAFEVPEGEDPAVLRAGLARHHFTSVAVDEGGVRRMLVECPGGVEHDRAEVHSIIEHVTADEYEAGVAAGRVQFDDEV
jgi:hypothetical protein